MLEALRVSNSNARQCKDELRECVESFEQYQSRTQSEIKELKTQLVMARPSRASLLQQEIYDLKQKLKRQDVCRDFNL